MNKTKGGINMKIINPNELKTIDDFVGLFIEWTNHMDQKYGQGTSERTDGTNWKENPADWMEPFSQKVFDVWLEYDSHNPLWRERAKDILRSKEDENKMS